jgi:segregation and condensation protein B
MTEPSPVDADESLETQHPPVDTVAPPPDDKTEPVVVVAVDDKRPFEAGPWVFVAIEALAFALPEPLAAARARDVLEAELADMDGLSDMAAPTVADVRQVFAELLGRWSDPTRAVGQGFVLVEVDGGLTFRTTAASARFIRRFQQGKPQKLSRAALETLSVIAYRQPVTKPQVEEIRGVDCAGAMKALLDKKLVRVLGKAEDVGRPLLYGTTKTFLDFFGLQGLTDLPTLLQLQELEGTAPVVDVSEAPPAVVMDLFDAGHPGLVSAETEEESADALRSLERALGEAKKVAKSASSVVFGLEVQDEDERAKNDDG